MTAGPKVERIAASAYTIPTAEPESDGTLTWDATTLVIVEAEAGGTKGLGYSYTHVAAARFTDDLLRGVVENRSALDVAGAWTEMHRAIRNHGRSGIVAAAIAAVDVALWDLKARLLDVPMVVALDAIHESVPVYGSGGFTSYSIPDLRKNLSQWLDRGVSAVKMKVGRDAEADIQRVRNAREAVGDDTVLMVDANGAYDVKQAARLAYSFADHGVEWFEEPVSSDDLEGMSLLRNIVPPGVEVTAGEYGYDLFYFRRMLEAGSVDVLQIDATRAAGFTGFLKAAVLAEAHGRPVSAHTAPNLHAHVCCATQHIRHVECFRDHLRIEDMFFDGALDVVGGQMHPDRSRPGMGITFRRTDAEPYRRF